MNGDDKSVYVEWALLLPERKRELKSILATAGYDWPRDKNLSDAIWATLVDTNETTICFCQCARLVRGGICFTG